MTDALPIAVIGSGLGGLASAAVLAARGRPVTVYDKNSWLGGKAAVLNEGGFRFDMGPTILTVRTCSAASSRKPASGLRTTSS